MTDEKGSEFVTLFLSDGKPISSRFITKTDFEARFVRFVEKMKYDSTPFWSRDYQGHMNFEVSQPHLRALMEALKYNANNVATESSRATTGLEVSFSKALGNEIFGYGPGSWGYVTDGGTISNIEALWIARNTVRKEFGVCSRYPRAVIASKDAHYSVEKACDILGLSLIQIEPNSDGMITGSIIEEALSHDTEIMKQVSEAGGILAVVAVIGTTETGAIDDVSSISKWCVEEAKRTGRKRSIWLHADAAYGGYFAYAKDKLSPECSHSFDCIKLCDSASVDPHKTGYAPYVSGFFALRDEKDREVIDFNPQDGYVGTQATSAWTLEGSRSGALIAAAAFGHEIMKNDYSWIHGDILDGAKKLRSLLSETGLFVVDNKTNLGLVLFYPKEHPERMQYYMKHFCIDGSKTDDSHFSGAECSPNVSGLRMAHTLHHGQLLFRVCVMDPTFKDYATEYVEKLVKRFKELDDLFETDLEKRFRMVREIAQECDTEPELRELLASGKPFCAYNGFEPSGRIHIAQAIITVLNANAIIEAGGFMIIYVADWFAMMNHKMGGDLDKIKDVGQYFVEVFKGAGINLKRTKFVWASKYIGSHPEYWLRVLDIATKTTVARVHKCCQIMGRGDKDALDESQHIYPCMQVADIFELGSEFPCSSGQTTCVDICQLGLDQRKANMLARDYASKKGLKPPVILSHHMLLGLKYNAGKAKKSVQPKAKQDGTVEAEDRIVPGSKMSKSDPDSAIFMDDTKEEIFRKLRGAFCNDDYIDNPVYDYIRYILLRWYGTVELCGKQYSHYSEVEKDWKDFDKRQLKEDVSVLVDGIVNNVRKHFDSSDELRQLKERVASYRVTR